MYLAFYGLAEKPFSITPDPRYLFLSGRHAEALAHLVYGVSEAGGFIQLTGEVGTGKTTIIRSLLVKAPKSAEIALILNPLMTPPEFLLTICEELGIGVPDDAQGSIKDLADILNRYLLRAHAAGRRVVLVVDEAQNLTPEILEQVRLLTNLETETQKLLQIILIGQPELRELLARNDLRQLAQRVTGRYHLDPLSRAETFAYVKHRLHIAGATADVFSSAALRELYRVSGGVPRVINVVADRALLGGFTEDRHRVSPAMVRRAAAEVFGRRVLSSWVPWSLATCCALLLGASIWTVLWLAPWNANPSGAQRAATPAIQGSASKTGQGAAVATPPPPPPAPAAPAAAVAEAAAPALVADVAQLLLQHAAQTDTDSAWTRLFALWQVQYLPGKLTACSQAAAQGLECLVQRGSLAQLRLFNRPAILVLSDATAMPHEVVITGLEDAHALLQLGEPPRRVDLNDLSRYWYGDFVLLWKPAAQDTRTLSRGMQGERVRALRARLMRWQGLQPASQGGEVFDNELAALVEEFQRQHRLSVDGVAGLQTQVMLDAALPEPGTPLLRAADSIAATAATQPLP